MTRRELDRIRFVTRSFKSLQGLNYIFPFFQILGLGCIYLAPRWYIQIGVVLVALFVPGNLFLPKHLPRYYRERFGEVEPWPADHSQSDYLMMLLLTLVALLLLSVSKPFMDGPIFYVSVGWFMVLHWLWLGHHPSQGYKAVLGVLLLGLAPASAFLSPVANTAWRIQEARMGLAQAVSGGVYILSCLLDHRLLVVTMGPRDVSHEAAASSSETEP
jgi:hypothetical protein